LTDVWFMVIFGIVGYFMRRYDLPTPPMILGLILGPMAEKYFMTSMIGEANDVTIFFRRPVSAVLMVASFGILLMPILRDLRKKKMKAPEAA